MCVSTSHKYLIVSIISNRKPQKRVFYWLIFPTEKFMMTTRNLLLQNYLHKLIYKDSARMFESQYVY